VYGTHCFVEVRAKVLCLDCMRRDAEAVVGEEVNRSLLRVRTRMVRVMGFGYGCLVAFGKVMAKGRGHMRGTGTKELVRLLESVVEMMVQVKQLADTSAAAGTTVQERVLASTLDSCGVVQVRLLERTAGNYLAAQAMLLESNAHSLWEVPARRRGMDHGTAGVVVPVRGPCTDRNAVVEVPVTLLDGGCSAALAVRARQLENAVGTAWAVVVSGHVCGSHGVKAQATLLERLQMVALKAVEAILRADSMALLMLVQATATRGSP
jgi:hypothetical protein